MAGKSRGGRGGRPWGGPWGGAWRGPWRGAVGILAVVGMAGVLLGAGDGVETELPTKELDALYYSRYGAQYTNEMLELGMRMGATITDARRGEHEQAKASFAQLKAQYEKVAGMVPSWKLRFPSQPLQALSTALDRKADVKELDPLTKKVEAVCTACHVRSMFPVQARYRWGNFSEAGVRDDNGRWISFHEIMIDLSNHVGAIRNDVTQGRIKEARVEYGHLKERFTMMELTCQSCHSQPREYFIDARVKGRLLRLGGLLRKGSKDVAAYTTLMGKLTDMSCIPCHQVHMPAAYLQMHWNDKK